MTAFFFRTSVKHYDWHDHVATGRQRVLDQRKWMAAEARSRGNRACSAAMSFSRGLGVRALTCLNRAAPSNAQLGYAGTLANKFDGMPMREQITIRRAENGDISALQEIFDQESNLKKLEGYSDNALAEAIKDPDSLFLVAIGDSVVMGFIWLSGLHDLEKGAKVEEFASRFPGIGVGSLLFHRGLEDALNLQHDRIWLVVAADNKAAIYFYGKYGFIPVELKKSYWPRRTGDIADGLVMEATSSHLIESFTRLGSDRKM